MAAHSDPKEPIALALVGGGMFGGDVVLRTIEDIERCGLAPYLGRVGLDHLARDVAGLRFRLAAIGTRTPETAQRLCAEYRSRLPGARPAPYWGEKPWEGIFRAKPRPEILFVATPDHLHAEPALHALDRGAHVMAEKPLALTVPEVDSVIQKAQERGLVAGVDMHKRYDPCHRFLFEELVPQIGKPFTAARSWKSPSRSRRAPSSGRSGPTPSATSASTGSTSSATTWASTRSRSTPWARRSFS